MKYNKNLYIDTFIDNKHEKALYEGLFIYKQLLETEKYSILKKTIFFTWGTSLMMKYKHKFKRFSKDLDFWVIISSKENRQLLSLFFLEAKELLEEYMRSNSYYLLDTNDKRKILFIWEQWDTREIKMDYMFDYIISYEYLPNLDIYKVSDIDIICNKLQRLSPIDISDILFLIKQNNYSKEEIASWLIEKSYWMTRDKYSILDNMIYKWQENISNLPILKDIISIYEQS